MPSILDQLLAPGALRVLFQPIFDVVGAQPVIVGAECLTRGPVGTNVELPDVLFSYARQKKAESEVDRASVAAALAAATRLPADLHLHLNVHASTLGRDRGFPEFLASRSSDAGRATDRLTVEVVEQSDYLDRAAFEGAIEELRALGFAIALDDVGLGRSNFLMIYLTRPTVIKADRFFVDGSSGDPVRRAVLVAIQGLAEELGAVVVAEGVEEEPDLVLVKELGIARVQGFLLGRPMSAEQLIAELGGRPS